MLKPVVAALGGAMLLAGCAYFPVPPDPIRIVDSRADVGTCRSLGIVGGPVSTDGQAPYLYGSLTTPVPAGSPAASAFWGFGTQPASSNLAVKLEPLRDEALRRGATDLLLVRKGRRDWSLVEGVAYRCPR